MNVRQILIRYPTLRHMLVSGTGSLLAPLFSFAGILAVVQLYSPADYGLWAVLMSIALIPGAVGTLRYELAMVLVEDERDAGTVFFFCMLLSFLVALASWAVTWGILLLIPTWQHQEGLMGWLWTVPLLVFLTGFIATSSAWCTRRQEFGVRTVSLIALAAIACGVQIGAYFAGMRGAGGLILGTVMGNTVSSSILLYFVLRRSPPAFFAGFMPRGIRPLAARYRNFPLFSVPYAFVGSLRLQGVTLLFGSLAAPHVVGYYAFAYRLTNFPVGLFSNGIRPVLFQKAARQTDPRNIQDFVENLLRVLSVLCLPGLVLFLARADHLFSAFLPDKWAGAAPYAKLLIVPAVAFLHTNWMDRILDVLQLQKLAFKMEAFFSLACLSALGLGLLVLDAPILAVALQAGCLLAYNAYYIHVIYRETGFDRQGLRYYCRCVAIQAGTLVVLFWVVNAMLPLNFSDLLFLAVAYGAGAIYLARHFARHLRRATPRYEPGVVKLETPESARLSA